MSRFELSTTLSGHEDDVRCVASLSNNEIVSGSRDSTVKIWRNDPKQRTPNFDDCVMNFKAERFINCLAIYDDGQQRLIASGGNDNLINLTSPYSTINEGNTSYCLVGHTANVSSLQCKDRYILSTSWDGTAKVWTKTGDVIYNLKGHKGPVWGASFLSGKDTFVTCGADKTIRIWEKSRLVKTIIAHKDVVRDVLVLPNGDIASCSNDSTVKIWDGKTYELKSVLSGHESFVYSICCLPDGDIVSCGEDRTIRVWRSGRCIQTITVPCVSVWDVTSLPNGDIVAGSSDSKIRVFSRSAERKASKEIISSFKKEVAESGVGEDLLANVNMEKLCGVNALKVNGKTEGELKIVKDESLVVVLYRWDENKWIKVGKMVTSSGSDRKIMYNGLSYDYVFDIDVEDGKPPLKLPFNVSDNPYEVADKFLADNNLPYSYLQQIVDFIMKNARGATIGESNASATRPHVKDAYQEKVPGGSSILPQQNYLTFKKVNVAQIMKGFKKLNTDQTEENRIDPREVEMALDGEDYDKLGKIAFQIILNWKTNTNLVGYDLLRVAIAEINPFGDIFTPIRKGLESEQPAVIMICVRILCNIFSASKWGEQTLMDPNILDVIFTSKLSATVQNEKTSNKQKRPLSVAVATLLLDFSVLINKFSFGPLYQKSVEIYDEYTSLLLDDEESSYRLLVGIGTLCKYRQTEQLKIFADSITSIYKDERFKMVQQEMK